MKIELKDIKKGDFVYCTGDSGFCDPSISKVLKITIQYDEKSGKPYNVIWTSDTSKYDSRNGGALSPPLAYYIVPIEKREAISKAEKSNRERRRFNRYGNKINAIKNKLSNLNFKALSLVDGYVIALSENPKYKRMTEIKDVEKPTPKFKRPEKTLPKSENNPK